LFDKLKRLFRPATVGLVFLKGGEIYFRCDQDYPVGKKINVTAKLPEGQEFGAIIRVTGIDEELDLHIGVLEQPKEAMKHLPNVLPLPFNDRRIQPRTERAVRVLSPQVVGYAAMSRNISEEGMCLVVGQPVASGTTMNLEMDVDAAGNQTLRLQMEARWCAKDGAGGKHLVGGRFLALTMAQRSALRGFLASAQPNYGGSGG